MIKETKQSLVAEVTEGSNMVTEVVGGKSMKKATDKKEVAEGKSMVKKTAVKTSKGSSDEVFDVDGIILEALENTQYKIYYDKKNNVFYYSDKSRGCNSKLVGDAFYIKKYYCDETEKKYYLDIVIWNAIERKAVTIKLCRDDIDKLLCKRIVSAGGVIIDKKLFKEYFLRIESNVVRGCVPEEVFFGYCAKVLYTHDEAWKKKRRMSYDEAFGALHRVVNMSPQNRNILCRQHRNIGWCNIDDKEVFASEKLIVSGGEIPSTYVGNTQIHQSGDFDKYKNMLKKHVTNSVELSTISSIAASATVLGYMNRTMGMSLYNPLVHIYGNSTTGKTTASELAVSFGGKPEHLGGNSLFTNLYGTTNAIIKRMSGNFGYPIVLDELSMNKNKLTEALYAIADGKDKCRCTAMGAGLQDQVAFQTTLITNGESSLLAQTNKNAGLGVRVFEFSNVMWTKDAESADEIKEVCKNNYGFITPLIAEKLLNMTNEEQSLLTEEYSKWAKKFISVSKDENTYIGTTDRIANVVALFMVSFKVLGNIIDFEVTADEVFQFLYKKLGMDVAGQANLGERAYDGFYNHYIEHQSEYCRCNYGEDRKEKCAGLEFDNGKVRTVNGVKYARSICFTQEQAEAIFIKRLGFSDLNIVMMELYKMGMLLTKDKSRLYATPFIYNGNNVTKGYRILLPEEAELLWAPMCLDD